MVKDLYDVYSALQHMDSEHKNRMNTAMRISRISTLPDAIDRLMDTDEYQEGLNTTKVTYGIPTLMFEAK